MHELTNNGKFAYANFDDEVLANASDYNEIVTEMNSFWSINASRIAVNISITIIIMPKSI